MWRGEWGGVEGREEWRDVMPMVLQRFVYNGSKRILTDPQRIRKGKQSVSID